jgi:Secretion system C-terminal sorting domain
LKKLGILLFQQALSKGANSPRAKIFIWHQNSNGSILDAPIIVNTYDIPDVLTISDLDCDGKNEVILAHCGWQSVSIIQGVNNTYQEIKRLPVPYISHFSSTITAKIGKKSKPDILVITLGPSDEKSSSMIILNNANTTESVVVLDTKIKQTRLKSDTIITTKSDTLIQKDSNAYRLITTKKITQIRQIQEIRNLKIDTIRTTKSTTCGEISMDTIVTFTILKDSFYFKKDTIVNINKDTITYNFISDRLEDDILIYPNPCDGYFYVKKINPNLKKKINLVIHAINGQFIKEVQFFDTLKDIDIQDLAGGAYMLTIIYGERAFHKLLINTP